MDEDPLFGTKRSLSKTEKLIRLQDITRVEVTASHPQHHLPPRKNTLG